MASILRMALVLTIVGTLASMAKTGLELTVPTAESSGDSIPVAIPTPLLTVDDDDDHHGMWGDWDSLGWWIFMLPVMVLFWGGVIWLIVWLVRQSSGGGSSRDSGPEEIARRRYARGEITREEFEQIRRDLRPE